MFSFFTKAVSLKHIERPYFNDNKAKIESGNLIINKILAVCGGSIYWILYIFSFIIPELEKCSTIYIVTSICMTVLAIYLLLFKKDTKRSLIILYGQIVFLAMAAIGLGTFCNEKNTAGIYIALVVVFSVIVIDKSWRVLLVQMLVNIVFIILSFSVKEPDVAIIDLLNVVIAVFMGHYLYRFCMKLMIENFNSVRQSMDSEKKEQQMKLLISQIQPHFMFNALTTIQYLCKSDPATASATTNHFAKYIRVNMDSLKKMEPVPFDKELSHVKNYLYIEQLRYGDRLNVEFDIQATDFEVPMISIQPLVENAIRHGIAKNESGGTIKISSFEDMHFYVVRVEDNGVGFDTLKYSMLEEDENKIGLANIRKRIVYMCKGTLSVESEVNKGTTATICIPKGGN